MLDDIRKPESERREWIVEILKDMDGKHTGFLHMGELVRCRECKHKYQEPWSNGVAVEGECEIWHRATLGDDFCSYGERKDNE